jgi:hypothetical protein
MGDDQEFLGRLQKLQLRLIHEQKTTDAITVSMAMSRLEALSGLLEREGLTVGSVVQPTGPFVGKIIVTHGIFAIVQGPGWSLSIPLSMLSAAPKP